MIDKLNRKFSLDAFTGDPFACCSSLEFVASSPEKLKGLHA